VEGKGTGTGEAPDTDTAVGSNSAFVEKTQEVEGDPLAFQAVLPSTCLGSPLAFLEEALERTGCSEPC